MRKLALWALVVSTLLACGTFSFGNIPDDLEINLPAGSESNLVPTAAVPDVDADANEDEADSTESVRIPPTWTPVSGSVSGGNPVPNPGIPEILPTTVPGIPPGAETYTVQPGDTLANIAYHFGVSVFDLAEANGIENIDLIEVGQVLVIP